MKPSTAKPLRAGLATAAALGITIVAWHLPWPLWRRFVLAAAGSLAAQELINAAVSAATDPQKIHALSQS